MKALRFRKWATFRWLAVTLLVLLAGLAFFLFPGQRLSLAFTIATGIGRDALQARVDALEERAIARGAFSADDRAFLVDLYSTLATGGKLVLVARQTGRMMDHYLGRSGADYELDPVIFTGNRKVQQQAERLRKRARRSPCKEGRRFSSGTFHMPDASNLDSVFGLYYGTLFLTQHLTASDQCRLRWRAQVPWVWPSYPSLRRKYGNPHAESFPLPSLESLALGRKHALFIDNGLGHHLEELGLAKSFLAFAEWSEGPTD